MGREMKPNTLVKFDVPKDWEEGYPFKNGETLLYLGDIEQMSGHCAVVNKEGRVFWGYHTDNFRALDGDEV
jgi:hypothetical protein